MLLCCVRRNIEWLPVINTSSSSSVKNKRRRLPSTTVNNLPRYVAAECIALGSRAVHSTRWSRISTENRLHVPNLHSTLPLGRSQLEYCHSVWYGKTRMVWLPDGEKIKDMLICFDRIHERDRRTDTQTPHDAAKMICLFHFPNCPFIFTYFNYFFRPGVMTIILYTAFNSRVVTFGTVSEECLAASFAISFLSASLYFSKRGAYWDRLCRDVVGRWSLVVTRVHCGQMVHPRPIVTMEH